MSQPSDLVARLPRELRQAFDLISGELERLGASVEQDVKTIYVSYMLESQMVAALYPRAKEFEIALALDEEHPSPMLRDATHLTWRTLPVSVVVKSVGEAPEVISLVQEAVRRVTEGIHDVHRENDHFMGRGKSSRRKF